MFNAVTNSATLLVRALTTAAGFRFDAGAGSRYLATTLLCRTFTLFGKRWRTLTANHATFSRSTVPPTCVFYSVEVSGSAIPRQ